MSPVTDIPQLESAVFAQGAGQYMRGRALVWARRWWWMAALILLPTAVLAFGDWRFAYVLLIELLLVFPGVMVPVWLNEALGPDARRETWPHRIGLSDSGVLVTYMPRYSADGDEYPLPKPEKYSWTDFAAYHDAGNCVILKWVAPRRAPLRLPAEAFDASQWPAAAQMLTKHIKPL